MVVLHTPVALQGKDLTTVGEFEIAEGQTIPFVMTHGFSHLAPPTQIDHHSALTETESFWTSWADRRAPDGDWDDASFDH
jgi:hypothetical protein